jgi:hypothetical protein
MNDDTMQRRHAYRAALGALALCTLWLALPVCAHEWHFDVAADGIRVGTHHVTVNENGDTGVATSDMSVGFLGIGAYRQHVEETWKNGCLARIASRTEERGHVTTVAGHQEGGAFRIDGDSQGGLPGCVMSFAYWNPNVVKQSHLVNVQTGAWTPVTVRDLGQQTIDAGGRSVQALHYAIETEKNMIEVWYSLQGEWLGLQTKTKTGGHVLAYRLRSRV